MNIKGLLHIATVLEGRGDRGRADFLRDIFQLLIKTTNEKRKCQDLLDECQWVLKDMPDRQALEGTTHELAEKIQGVL